MCGPVQEIGPLPQPWNIRLEASPSGILVGDFVQAANALYDRCHPTEKNRDECGHRAENEGRSRRLRHHLRKLTGIRDKVHASAPSISEVRAVARCPTAASSCRSRIPAGRKGGGRQIRLWAEFTEPIVRLSSELCPTPMA